MPASSSTRVLRCRSAPRSLSPKGADPAKLGCSVQGFGDNGCVRCGVGGSSGEDEERVSNGRDDNVDQTEAESLVISMPEFDGSPGSPTRLDVSLNLDRSRILSALVCINIVWRRDGTPCRQRRGLEWCPISDCLHNLRDSRNLLSMFIRDEDVAPSHILLLETSMDDIQVGTRLHALLFFPALLLLLRSRLGVSGPFETLESQYTRDLKLKTGKPGCKDGQVHSQVVCCFLSRYGGTRELQPISESGKSRDKHGSMFSLDQTTTARVSCSHHCCQLPGTTRFLSDPASKAHSFVLAQACQSHRSSVCSALKKGHPYTLTPENTPESSPDGANHQPCP